LEEKISASKCTFPSFIINLEQEECIAAEESPI
jgi:hypothetical protein